jgi:hypothetical protein
MSNNYAWIITRDLVAEAGESSAVGLIGPSDATGELLAALKLGVAEELPVPHTCEPFRMYDDDRNLCYEGFAIGEGRSDLEPLEEFGLQNAGCTELWYDCGKTGLWRRAK